MAQATQAETANLKLSRKQQIALDLLNDPTVVELDFGGAAGGAKSWTVCLWMLLECVQYPGIRIGLGRKELTRLKQTTVVTLLREVHPVLGVKPTEYSYSDQKALIIYENGSQIQLVDLARQPSDPDFDTLGSYNFSHIVIEESGEISKKAKDVFGSRKNRFMNKEYGIVGKTVLTQNPSQNFTRQEFFEPYKALGMGDYQKWPIGDVEVNGVMQTAYRAFVKSLPTDNPFLPRNYIEDLKRLPTQERKRLYKGDWDYITNDDMLFTDLLIDRSLIGEVPEGKTTVAADIADKGKDKTIVSVCIGNVLTEQIEVHVDVTGEKAISEQTALEIIKIVQQRGLTPSDAKDIAIDVIGVGVGVRDFMRSKGWYITEFIAGASASKPGYRNLRSEAYYDMSQDMDKHEFMIYNQLSTLADNGESIGLRRQLKAHEYTTEERVIVVLPKKKVKEEIGVSPDHADSAVMARWISKGGHIDPKNDASRVSW